MTAPTDQEKELVPKFRERLNDVLVTEEQKSDPFLLRWLRARDLDMDKAEQMLRSDLTWRKEHNVDQIFDKEFNPWYKENFPYWIDSFDKKGHPCMEMPLGCWDIRRAMNNEFECDFEGFINFFFERILQAIRDTNKKREEAGETSWPVTQWTVIVDWKGYSYGQLIHWKALQNTLKFAASYEAHYPEVLYKCYFVNCPSVFPLFMAMLKKVLVPKTVGKITCYSTEEEWRPALMEDIGEDNLGHMYGGKKVRMVGDKVYNYDAVRDVIASEKQG